MRIAVTGSIATDHLMSFPGRITDQLIADEIAHVSLSFLVDTLEVRQGGVAANIAYGLAALGHRPVLVGAVGADFSSYGEQLLHQGVETGAVRVSGSRHTARFVCTTDSDGNQIAAFYAGAMAEAVDIDLEAVVREHGVDYALIGADEPQAMLRHTQACRALAIPFAADPSQQLASLDGALTRELIDGAGYLFTNEYEHALLLRKTEWSREDVLDRVGTWVTTLGEKGCRIERAGEPEVSVAAVPCAVVVDPTGAGDAFRAGFLSAMSAEQDTVRAAQAGCAMASLALAAVGTQTYEVTPERLRALLADAYGTRPVEVVDQDEIGSSVRRVA